MGLSVGGDDDGSDVESLKLPLIKRIKEINAMTHGASQYAGGYHNLQTRPTGLVDGATIGIPRRSVRALSPAVPQLCLANFRGSSHQNIVYSGGIDGLITGWDAVTLEERITMSSSAVNALGASLPPSNLGQTFGTPRRPTAPPAVNTTPRVPHFTPRTTVTRLSSTLNGGMSATVLRLGRARAAVNGVIGDFCVCFVCRR